MGRKITSLLICLAVTASVLCSCGNVLESWAYIHDPQTEILSLSDNGKAVYKGSNYKYTKDDSFITLKDSSGGETKLRYVTDGDNIILYESSTYDFDGEGEPNGVIGVWVQDNGWSFQFTEKGTFAEENIFHGHYIVDENAHTIKLAYEEPMEDALLYYSLDGKKLTIEYPWPMVRTDSGK
ncbi:MAG: hypothetical protein K6G58_03730 [Lachnospiraceae bacterium]|nr:hypothetical protein [Lachnospiraceae bacterium]